MVIENTPLWRAAREVIASGQTSGNFGWEARVHLAGETLVPLMVIGVNVERRYVDRFTDEMTCTLLFPLGKYARRIYPGRDDLQITLAKVPLNEISGAVNQAIPFTAERYSALLLDHGPAVAEGQGAEANDEMVLDLTDLIEVNFQLFNKAAEQLRLITVGGSFRKTRLDDLILSLLTKEAGKVSVYEERALSGVDLVPVSNTAVNEQVVITQGTRLVDVVDYLQKRIGIYNSSVGSFFQNKFWYVFPLHDATRFSERLKTLTILVLPKRKFSDIERTFMLKGDSLVVLASSETGFHDDSGSQYLREGNGARFADANKIMEGSGQTKGNRVVLSRGGTNSEFIADTRAGGINNVQVPSQRITANPFSVYSQLNARNGGTFKLVWQNSDSSVIIPGMATRIVYFDVDQIKEIYGVVHHAIHVSHKTGDYGSRKFNNQTVLSVFVNRSVTE